ncbi:uncharacterized protein LOC120290494 [Eucalyptus grandis]|uniref:uncharacterized protein LOC120290494 n=1 Tax=Eucalyptus grandis TaxID=71139 RepID=UPI00192E7608|nr:uncharacterized protein LOC120290494 [Eucalyptus grandis]
MVRTFGMGEENEGVVFSYSLVVFVPPRKFGEFASCPCRPSNDPRGCRRAEREPVKRPVATVVAVTADVETNDGENLREDEPRLPESKWIIYINKNLDRPEQDHRARSWAKRSIYWIPHRLKDGKEKACVPQIVSLNQYHHSDERLCKKDKDKWHGLMCMPRHKNQKIEDYLDTVKQVDERAHTCYEGTIKMRSEESIMMMDMILLKDQIPLFILDLIICLRLGRPDQDGVLADLTKTGSWRSSSSTL